MELLPFMEIIQQDSFMISHPKSPGQWVVEVEVSKHQRVVVFRGTANDCTGYAQYLLECHNWLKGGEKGETPIFQRKETAKLRPAMSFDSRLEFATNLIRERGYYHRALDCCFEMGDGDKMVRALMNRAKADPFLDYAIKAQGEDHYANWQNVLDTNPDMPLLQLV